MSMKQHAGVEWGRPLQKQKRVLGTERRVALQLKVKLITVTHLTVLLRQKMCVMVAVFSSYVKAKYCIHLRN